MYIVGSIVVVIIIAVIFCVLAVLAKHILMFNSVPCPECDSYMQYRGEKKTKNGPVYIFQCPKCNAVKEIPAKEFNARLYDLHNNINVY